MYVAEWTDGYIILSLRKLITALFLDKRAFFLVSMSAVGAQIYELVANSKDEKNKFVQVHTQTICTL